MSHYVTNKVAICGGKSQIATLKKRVKLHGKDKYGMDCIGFDFNGMIPMPPELKIPLGPWAKDGLDALLLEHWSRYGAEWIERRYGGEVKSQGDLKAYLQMEPERLVQGLSALNNLRLYGHKDSEDWSRANWGTKWNSLNVRLLEETDDEIIVKFDTADAPPNPIFEALFYEDFFADCEIV